MSYTARLKVFCENKMILSNLNYNLRNTTSKKRFNGKLDSNGCTKVYDCYKADVIFVDLILNSSKLATVRVPALENGEFNRSAYKLKVASGTTSKDKNNTVPVKIKNELDIALENLHATAVYFGNNFLAHDAHLRQIYIRETKKMSERYIQLVKDGKMSVKDAATEANSLRNEILEGIRKKSSPIGLASAQKEKLMVKTMDEFLEYYAMELKNPNEFKRLKSISRHAIDSEIKKTVYSNKSYFKQLNAQQKNRIYYSILKGSGKSNPKFNAKIKFMKNFGRTLVVFSIAYAGYEIYNADNREKEVYKQGATIGGGIAGGAGGGAIAGGICGPASPICSTVGVIIGGIVGGYAAYKIVDAFDDELEAFTTWTVF